MQDVYANFDISEEILEAVARLSLASLRGRPRPRPPGAYRRRRRLGGLPPERPPSEPARA